MKFIDVFNIKKGSFSAWWTPEGVSVYSQVISVILLHEKAPSVIWVITSMFISQFTTAPSTWTRPHFWRYNPQPSLLSVYTALLIGELLSFFCVWTLGKLRCHALLHSHKKTHWDDVMTQQERPGVGAPIGPYDHIWRVDVGTMT